MKTSRKMATVLMLTSLFLLGACGKSDKKATTASSTTKSSKVVKKNNTSNSSKNTKTSSSDSSKQASQDDNGATNQSNAASANNSQAASGTASAIQNDSSQNQTVDSSIDVNALANQDYSSIAGTWSNDLGETITISADGHATGSDYPKTYDLGTGQVNNGNFFGSIHNPETDYGNAAFIVIPAGVANIHSGEVENSDRILIGQSAEADNHPFYRN